jgi:hypothetical protein
MERERDLDWPRVARWAVAICIVAVSISGRLDRANIGGVITLAIAATAFWLLKLKARREQERRIEAAELREATRQ